MRIFSRLFFLMLATVMVMSAVVLLWPKPPAIDKEAETVLSDVSRGWMAANANGNRENFQIKELAREGNLVQFVVSMDVQLEQYGYWWPFEGVVTLQKNGKTWEVQSSTGFQSPFEAALFVASERTGKQCVETFPRQLAPNEYPCIKLFNKGRLDWKWTNFWFSVEGPNYSYTGTDPCPPGIIVLKANETLNCFSPVLVENMNIPPDSPRLQLIANNENPWWRKLFYEEHPIVVADIPLR